MSRSSSSTRFRTLGGLAVATLFLVAQASTFTHRLLVQHVVCAEHGELVHAEKRAQAATGFERELREIPAVPDDHGHDHCLITLPRREDFAAAEAPSDGVIVRKLALPLEAIDRAGSAVTSLELLLLAPKSSPPA